MLGLLKDPNLSLQRRCASIIKERLKSFERLSTLKKFLWCFKKILVLRFNQVVLIDLHQFQFIFYKKRFIYTIFLVLPISVIEFNVQLCLISHCISVYFVWFNIMFVLFLSVLLLVTYDHLYSSKTHNKRLWTRWKWKLLCNDSAGNYETIINVICIFYLHWTASLFKNVILMMIWLFI